MKLIYDKIQFFGGAERVLLQINNALNPTTIVTVYNICDPALNNINKKTVYPKWGKLFADIKIFIIFYPLVCLLSSFLRVKDDTIKVQGVGIFTYKTLKKNVEKKLKDLTRRNKQGAHYGVKENQFKMLQTMWLALNNYEEKN